MKFTPDPDFEREVMRSREMAAFLEDVADEGADEAEGLAPPFLTHRGARFEGVVVRDAGGVHAEVRVHSSFWHWPEFSTVKMPASPYLRPGVLKVLSRRGGRLEER